MSINYLKPLFGILLFLSASGCSVDDIVVPDSERVVPEDYLAFAEEEKEWIFAGEEGYGNKPIELYRYRIMGDTVLRGKIYKKMYVREADTSGDAQYHYIGAVRDTLMKVMFTDSGKRTERLIYDFGLKDMNQMRWYGYTLIASDAYQKVVHGIARNVLPVWSSNNAFHDIWIEGIGCARGGLISYDPIMKRKCVLMRCENVDGCCYDYETDNELYE
ncbi:MAG: hypothetical protein IJJ94_01860 [Bacteroidaceae bacterium]|nr:hypothetical protein [Bacteroidaceae bacterium]